MTIVGSLVFSPGTRVGTGAIDGRTTGGVVTGPRVSGAVVGKGRPTTVAVGRGTGIVVGKATGGATDPVGRGPGKVVG